MRLSQNDLDAASATESAAAKAPPDEAAREVAARIKTLQRDLADAAGISQHSADEGLSALIVNDLRFEVRRSDRRRALEITVDRGGELILSAPPDVPDAKLRDFAVRKRMWVYKQLARKEALGDQTPRKVFTDGERFAYLGRNYRLRLMPESDAAVKRIGGRFVMPKALARDGREHLIRWYCGRAQPWLADKV